MCTAELFEVEWFEPLHGASDYTPGSVSISPCAEEALASWLLRYAAPWALAPETLLLDRAEAGLIDRADWWRRPDPWLLERLAVRTGLAHSALAGMTFLHFSCQDWREEMFERFARWRFQRPHTIKRCLHRFAICPQCLAEDPTPYVRRLWMLGWAGVCPIHACLLWARCPQCDQTLRLPTLGAQRPFTPERCRRCGVLLRTAALIPAYPLAMRLQELLLAHRPAAAVPLPDIGLLQWPAAMALFEFLLGMVWDGPAHRLRNQLFARVHRDWDLTEELGDKHYDGLLILAWLLDQWPQHLQVAAAILETPHSPQQLRRWRRLDLGLKASIGQVFVHAWPDEGHPPDRAQWGPWIDTLPLTGEQLRVLAAQDHYRWRRVRLLALADLRDGMSVEKTAARAGVIPRTVCRWLKRGIQGGLQAALERAYAKTGPTQMLEVADARSSASAPEPC